MDKTWMPAVAGILAIVSGGLGLIWSYILVILGTVGSAVLSFVEAEIPAFVPGVVFSAIAIPLFAVSVLAIVGGVFALQRKRWRWALAGSIVAIFSSAIFGMVSTVLIALSRKEFPKS